VVAPDPSPERPAARPPGWEAALIIGGGLALIVAVLWGVSSLPRGRGMARAVAGPKATRRPANSAYLGSRACRECHPNEYALYLRSGHSHTLHDAAQIPLARKLDGRVVADPERPGVSWTFALRDGHFGVDRAEGGSVERMLFDYALGSGHHATTFVTVTDPSTPTAVEHRLTHFSRDDSVRITPGQRAERPAEGTTPRGRDLSPRETLKCFGCHATQLSTEPGSFMDPATTIRDVSCERCHGPGRSHVAAARRGLATLAMPFGPDRWTADSQLRLCGECHRHPDKANPGQIRPDDPALVRFQPVGLIRSECYTRSRGELSCVDCHDPHARVSTDRASYEAVCLKCHQAAPRQTCPVSPRGGCIDCHMPRVDSGQQVLFTDHWIRVRPPAGR
jgi:hypothetical protein